MTVRVGEAAPNTYLMPPASSYTRAIEAQSKESSSGGYFSYIFSIVLAPFRWIKALFAKIFSCFRCKVDTMALITSQVEGLLSVIQKINGVENRSELLSDYSYKYGKLLSYVREGLEATAIQFLRQPKFHKTLHPLIYKKEEDLNISQEEINALAKRIMQTPLHDSYRIELVLEDYLSYFN